MILDPFVQETWNNVEYGCKDIGTSLFTDIGWGYILGVTGTLLVDYNYE